MKIAIAGGTGTVGQKIVAEARRRGHDTAVLARASGADLITGAGVDAALEFERRIDAGARDQVGA